ncbi:MAG TPA: hypothetical protein VJ873_12725 [bacterium]|nr:hypothetical protein [bacterium]
MKKILLSILLAVYLTAGSTVKAQDQKGPVSKQVTVSGTLVDAYCYMKEGDLTETHANIKSCGTECLKEDLPAGILADGKLYVLIFPGTAFMNYIYKQVEVTGELYGDSDLIPLKATAIVDGQKKSIKLAGKVMM